MICSDASTGAAEPLAGTASRAHRFLLLEHRGAWGRDALADTELSAELRAAVEAFDGRVLLLRRPARRSGRAAILFAEATEAGGSLARLASAGDVAGGVPTPGPLILVCTHGRRDPCCARLGGPVYDALRPHFHAESLWQSSHQGGHRFAANLLVLPHGVQLGRVGPGDAAAVAGLVADGRIPLAHYRGRTLYPPHVQAAEVALRRRLGLDAVGDVRLLEDGAGKVRFATRDREACLAVEDSEGPPVPASCGVEPEPTPRYAVRLESLG